QAAAADAARQPVARALQQRDSLVQSAVDPLADRLPVARRRRAADRELRQLGLDLAHAQPELLDDHRERQTANVGAQETALVAAGPDRLEQPLRLVEADR